MSMQDAGTLLAVASETLERGDAAGALTHCDAAIAQAPDSPQVLFVRGRALAKLRRFEEASTSFESVCRLTPEWSDAWANRGKMLAALGRLEEAHASFSAAIALRPEHPRYRVDRANIESELGRFAEAMADVEVALAPAPSAAAYASLFLIRSRQGRFQDAIEVADRALELYPATPELRLNRGCALLALGRFVEGWRDYEYRSAALEAIGANLNQHSARLKARFGSPYDMDVTQGSVMVVGEQGIGDVLMFSTILPDLIRDAKSVALLTEFRLLRLFGNSFPGLTLLASDSGTDAYQHVLPIGGLGALYRRSRDDFPGTPVLRPTDWARESASEWLGQRRAKLRVGLSWRGGTARTGASSRSIPLAQLAPILTSPDVEFVSLQYGDVAEEIAAVNAALGVDIRVPDPAAVRDFDDLAATVLEMDLVVTVQTALAHLSGAVGAPCRAMVPWAAEWRYGATGDTMPWYRSVRVLRQGEERAWEPVIRDVAAELRSLAAG